MFSLSTDPSHWFPRDSSLIVSLLSAAGFSVPITVSCDEDVEEVGEDEVVELVDRPGDNEWKVIPYIATDCLVILGEMWFFYR